ncbi:hypothetical protein HHI36_018658, partial [Cryptolaemus montrouzieri]
SGEDGVADHKKSIEGRRVVSTSVEKSPLLYYIPDTKHNFRGSDGFKLLVEHILNNEGLRSQDDSVINKLAEFQIAKEKKQLLMWQVTFYVKFRFQN